MVFPAKAILFDLDGTLIDSIPDIANAANLMLAELGMAQAEDDQLRRWVGNGAPKLVKRALTGELDGEPDVELYERALSLFFDLYLHHIWDRSALYPGVEDALRFFRQQDFKLACVTNKPVRHTNALLDAAKLFDLFDCVVGGDSLPTRKPAPEPLLHAATLCDVTPSDCVMVGDSINDILAAQAARMPVLCLSYGYNQGLDLSAYNPDALLNSFTDLAPLITLADDMTSTKSTA